MTFADLDLVPPLLEALDVLGLALDVVSRAPMEGVGYGVFRM